MPEINKINYQELNEENGSYWLILKDFKKFKKIMNIYNCEKQYSTYPSFLIESNKNWRDKELNWYVIYCKK